MREGLPESCSIVFARIPVLFSVFLSIAKFGGAEELPTTFDPIGCIRRGPLKALADGSPFGDVDLTAIQLVKSSDRAPARPRSRFFGPFGGISKVWW